MDAGIYSISSVLALVNCATYVRGNHNSKLFIYKSVQYDNNLYITGETRKQQQTNKKTNNKGIGLLY
jgi:hypothetical protein